MSEEKTERDEGREVEEHLEDLELPDETSEDVKGGKSLPNKLK